METLIWIGFSISAFAASILSAKPSNSAPQKILCIWLYVFAADFLLRAIEIYTYGQTLTSNTFLLLNPLLYLYTKSLTCNNFKLSPIQLLHLAPFVILEVIILIYGKAFSLEAFINGTTDTWLYIVIIIVSALSWIIYISSSSFLLIRHNKILKNEFSTVDKRNSIIWLKIIATFYILYCLTTGVLGLYFIFNKHDSIILVYIISSVSLFMVFVFSYYGLLQELIFTNPVTTKINTPPPSFFSESKISIIKKEIYSYFENEKPYLDSEFNMEQFAQKLKIPKHQLTYILNQNIGKNFFQFVNEYRIEDVKKALLNPNNAFSIEAIGYDCGFSTKSTFFTIFKKITGQTPMQYRKTHLFA